MDWKKNLYQYTEQPPKGIWEAVSRELDEDIPAVREKMYGYEAIPPIAVWQAVSEDISAKETAPSPVLWYQKPWNVAAAAVTAAVFFGAIYLYPEKFTKGAATAVINPVSQQTPENTQQPAPSVASERTDQPALPVQVQPIQESAKPIAENITSKPVARKRKPIKKINDSNYIYFTAADGEQMRLSYKLQPLLPAIRTKKHNDMLDQWSAALENSAFVPSGSNFFDIVDMIRMVDQKLP